MHEFILPKNPMDELENNKREAEKALSPKDHYDKKKAEKDRERQQKKGKEKTVRGGKKIVKRMVWTIGILVIIGAGVWLLALAPNLPPTSSQNHSETIPASHIITTQMPDAIQRHMLEHADGGGAPGIIIQYNCDDYDCEADLIQKLTSLVEGYPDNVYLAPNVYDGKIILTREGGREVLDEFNEQIIKNFIEQ